MQLWIQHATFQISSDILLHDAFHKIISFFTFLSPFALEEVAYIYQRQEILESNISDISNLPSLKGVWKWSIILRFQGYFPSLTYSTHTNTLLWHRKVFFFCSLKMHFVYIIRMRNFTVKLLEIKFLIALNPQFRRHFIPEKMYFVYEEHNELYGTIAVWNLCHCISYGVCGFWILLSSQ